MDKRNFFCNLGIVIGIFIMASGIWNEPRYILWGIGTIIVIGSALLRKEKEVKNEETTPAR